MLDDYNENRPLLDRKDVRRAPKSLQSLDGAEFRRHTYLLFERAPMIGGTPAQYLSFPASGPTFMTL